MKGSSSSLLIGNNISLKKRGGGVLISSMDASHLIHFERKPIIIHEQTEGV
jgi:hypothetical protein